MFTYCGRPHEIPCVLMRHRKFNHDICGLCFCAPYKRTLTRCNGNEPRLTCRAFMLYLCRIWYDGTRQNTPRIYYQCSWSYSLPWYIRICAENGCIPKKKIIRIQNSWIPYAMGTQKCLENTGQICELCIKL